MGHSVDFGQSQIGLQAQAQPVIKDSLRIIGDLVENVLNEITQTKTLCFNCIKEYLDIALWDELYKNRSFRKTDSE